MKGRASQGFTLIELLVVIAIIGILAVLVIAAVRNSRNKAHDARIKSSLSQMRYLAEQTYDDAGGTFINWTTRADQTQLGILEDDIDTNTGFPGQVVKCDSQPIDYCVSAPQRDDATRYYCLDATAVLQETGSPCNCVALPLRCPST